MASQSLTEPRILIVEENEYHGLLMEQQISRRLDVTSVVITSSPDEALQYARSSRFDVAVVDLALGECDGLSFLKSLYQVAPDLAVIVVAEQITEAITREVLRSGCREILVKDSSYYLVIPRLVAGLIHRSRIPGDQKADLCRYKRNVVKCVADNLRNDLSAPTESILAMTGEIIGKTLDNKMLTDRIAAIRRSALEIKASLRTLECPCESGRPVDSNEREGLFKARFRTKSLV